MTRRERVIQCLKHEETDFIPYHAHLTTQELERVTAYTGDPDYLETRGKHLHYLQYQGWPKELANHRGYFQDDFKVVWNRSGPDKDIGVIECPVICEPDIRLWPTPKLDEARLRLEYSELLSHRKDKFAMAGIGICFFERAWSLCGMENLLIYMLEEPEFVHALLDEICEYNLKIMVIVANNTDKPCRI